MQLLFLEHNGETLTTAGSSARLLHCVRHMMLKDVHYVHKILYMIAVFST